jgi:hypothetical protein
MLEIVPFKPEHLVALQLQAVQASAQPLMTLEYGQQIASTVHYARTGMVDGVVIGCAGLTELWNGRAYAWAYLSEGWERHARAVHRAVLDGLRVCRWRRVEMAIDIRYPGAKRWAWHLGFTFEGVARAFTPDGRDCEIWARVAP